MQRGEAFDIGVLVGDVFGMFKGKVEENPFRLGQALVLAGRQTLLAKMKREPVLSEGARAGAEDVAAHLVEHDDRCEAAFRPPCGPVFSEWTGRKGFEQRQEFRFKFGVESLAAIEP